MKEPKMRFTGIFIPAEILAMEDLSPCEKFLLSWIDSLFCSQHGGCFASNSYLAEKLKVKENSIAKSISKFRTLHLIKDISFNGRKRVIKACINEYVEFCQSNAGLDLNPMQGWIKIQGRVGEKSNPSYIYSKEDSKVDQSKEAIDRFSSSLSSSEEKDLTPTIPPPDPKIHDCLKELPLPTEEQISLTKKYPDEERMKGAVQFATKLEVAPLNLAALLVSNYQNNRQLAQSTETVSNKNRSFAIRFQKLVKKYICTKFPSHIELLNAGLEFSPGGQSIPLFWEWNKIDFLARIKNYFENKNLWYKEMEELYEEYYPTT